MFSLLKAMCVDARYNPYFVVAKEDIIPKLEGVRDITERICGEWIKGDREIKY